MEEVFSTTGEGILAALGAAGVIGLTYWLLVGFDATDGQAGPLGEYIIRMLGSAIGA